MTKKQKLYLELIGFNDYEIEEVETEIKNGEKPYVFEHFYTWESGYDRGYHDAQENYMNVIDNQHKLVAERNKKAIEVLEGLMRFCRCFAQHHTEDIRYKEAEQFLKECE